MPVKNAAIWLDECLLSIVEQSFTSWELIAVDDGSSDNSYAVLTQWAVRDARIRVVKNKEQGIIPALDTAYQLTQGSFITRMDADDKMPTNKLALFFENMNKANPKTIVTGWVNYFSDFPISKGYLAYEKWLNQRCNENDHWNHVYRECVVASANWMTHKSNIDAIGGFKSLIYPEDYHMVLKWKEKQLDIISINEITHLWREHPERTSRNSDDYQQEAFFSIKIKHFISHEISSNDNLVVLGTGRKGKLTADLLQQNGIEFTWIENQEETTELKNKKVYPVKQMSLITNPKVLIAVYPEDRIRQSIDRYLQNLNLSLGIGYWYL